MDHSLINSLHTRFPIIFRNKIHIWCDNGWYDLIYELSQNLETIALDQRQPKAQPLFKKKVFGLLAKIDPEFKYLPNKLVNWCVPETDSRLIVVQIKEKFGGLRYTVRNTNNEVRKLIHDAKEKSFTICEICGNKGEVYNIRGWLTTLCDSHHVEKITNAVGGSA